MLGVCEWARICLCGAKLRGVCAPEPGARGGHPRPGTEGAALADADPAPPLPVPVDAPQPVPAERPGLRGRHPFGSLGVAFIAGVAFAAAKSLLGQHWPALKRRLT